MNVIFDFAFSRLRANRPGGAILGALLLAALVNTGTTRAAEKRPEPSPDEPVSEEGQQAADLAKSALEAKLNRIFLSEVSFTNTPMDDVIKFLRLRSEELDPDKDIASNGVNFALQHHRMPDGSLINPGKITVTYQIRDVSMRQALEDIARVANLTMTVGARAVTFGQAGIAKPPMPMIVVKPRTLENLPGKAAKSAGKIVIPTLNFANLTLSEAIGLLNNEAKNHAGAIKTPLITLHPKADADMRLKELKLRNVPLDVALIHLSDLSRCKILADDQEIRLVPAALRNP
jgi:hypothetical protein